MNKPIVISEIGGTLHLDEEDSKWLYNHVSEELKSSLDKIMNSPKVAITLPEAIDYLFGTLANKLRCNKWLVRIVNESKEKYPHLNVVDIPTELFAIEFDRKDGELLRSQNNFDWEEREQWRTE